MLFNLKFIRILFLIAPLYFSLCFSIAIDEKLQNPLLEDLQTAKYHISTKYGPAEWKESYLGWNLDKEYEKAKQSIVSGHLVTMKDYQKIFKDFLLSTRDYHVGAMFYSTEISFFPLTIKGIKGHYYITSLNKSLNLNASEDTFKLDEVDFPTLNQNLKSVRFGDEVLALNGVPIDEVVEQIIDDYFAGNRSKTGYNLAERTVFIRRAKMGISVPAGLFELTLRHDNKKPPFKVQLPWFHIPEWVKNPLLNHSIQMNVNSSDRIRPSSCTALDRLITKDFSVAIAKDLMTIPAVFSENANAFEALLAAGGKGNKADKIDFRLKGFLPPLGKVLWETPKKYKIYAYLYQNSYNQNVGYIYLPSFSFEGQYDAIMFELISIIQRFKQESEALVFDTTNNTGGNLFFMYAVLALLSDKPMHLPVHRELIIQEDVFNALNSYNQLSSLNLKDEQETLSGYPFTPRVVELIKEYSLNIIRNWEAGHRLTQPLYLVGIDEVQPHPKVQYSKPLVVLINELNLSCGDFFPAILQDNNRAILFGQTTAGAGGHVKSYSYPSRFGVQSFSLTASIAYRNNGIPIEDIGVSPDVSYEITRKDIQNQYSGYIRAVNKEVSKGCAKCLK